MSEHVYTMNERQIAMMVRDNQANTIAATDYKGVQIVCYAIEGNVVDRASAKNGKGWCENVSPTLNTQDRHAVVIAIDQQGGKGNCSYAQDIMPTLLSDSHGTPHAICCQLCGDRDNPSVSTSDKAYCIPANPMSDRGQAVCYEK